MAPSDGHAQSGRHASAAAASSAAVRGRWVIKVAAREARREDAVYLEAQRQDDVREQFLLGALRRHHHQPPERRHQAPVVLQRATADGGEEHA